MSVILRPDFPRHTSKDCPFCGGENMDCTWGLHPEDRTSSSQPSKPDDKKAPAPVPFGEPAGAGVPPIVADEGDKHILVDLLLANIEAAAKRTTDHAIQRLERADFPLGDRKVLHYQECLREIYADVLSRLRMIQDDIHDDMDRYNGDQS